MVNFHVFRFQNLFSVLWARGLLRSFFLLFFFASVWCLGTSNLPHFDWTRQGVVFLSVRSLRNRLSFCSAVFGNQHWCVTACLLKWPKSSYFPVPNSDLFKSAKCTFTMLWKDETSDGIGCGFQSNARLKPWLIDSQLLLVH